jgi:hypothetical protein
MVESPQTPAEVADIVRAAYDADRTLEIIGTGARRPLGHPVAADQTVSLAALDRVLIYEPEELVLTVQAGAASIWLLSRPISVRSGASPRAPGPSAAPSQPASAAHAAPAPAPRATTCWASRRSMASASLSPPAAGW